MQRLSGTITPRGGLHGALAARGAISGTVNKASSATYDTYEGPYESDALFSAQTFQTAQKVMTGDFTVHAINYTEAPNDYGTTVTIGG